MTIKPRRRPIIDVPLPEERQVVSTEDITDWQVVNACWSASINRARSLDLLVLRTGAPPKAAEAAIERAERRGLVEVGRSAATAWPTDKGRKLLRSPEIDQEEATTPTPAEVPQEDASPQEESVHSFVPHGTGHFSIGTCTGCDWKGRGHAEKIRREFDLIHEGPEGGRSPVPPRVRVPEPTGDAFLDMTEARIIQLCTHKIDFKHEQAMFVAVGLAEARSNYRALVAHLPPSMPAEYVADVMARVSSLSVRQRAKLRVITLSRAGMQQILEG